MYSKDSQFSVEPKIHQSENKRRQIICSSQDIEIQAQGKSILNFCSNNYLGFSNKHKIITEIYADINSYENRTSETNFDNKNKENYKKLENKISNFLEMEDTIVYASSFDANGSIFSPLFTYQDAVISDKLNHTSLIDGVLKSKADHYYYKSNNLENLENQLQKISLKNYRFKIVIINGVSPMDGTIADLKSICDLTEKYNAKLIVDDSHATGFIGEKGKGTHEHNQVIGRVDSIISTLGMSLGGSLGYFVSGKTEIIELLKNRKCKYQFSNILSPTMVDTVIKIVDKISEDTSLAQKLIQNSEYFKKEIKKQGFDIIDGGIAIVPVLIYDAKLAQEFADRLYSEGIYALGFFPPVVPTGKARIRVQISAGHTKEHLNCAIYAFTKIGNELGII